MDTFTLKLVVILPDHTGINDYAINLIDSKQSSYGPIYSLWPVELKILKIYIKTNLVNNFEGPFKLLVDALIFFVWKLDSSLPL